MPLTNDELAVLDNLTAFWNSYALLSTIGAGPNEALDTIRDVHDIQHRIMARSARRDHPGVFR